MSEINDLTRLIEGCAANDRLAQEKLYRKFYPMLFCLCKKFFKDDHEAIEVLNDGMLKVFKNILKYRENEGSFFNWIYTIVRNTALDKIKLASQPVYIEVGSDMDIAENDNPLKRIEGREVFQLLDCLPPATRAVCSLFYMEGFTITNICEVLKLSPGTVKWHLSESRKKLHPVVEKYYSKNKP